jgi:hypothetical protein
MSKESIVINKDNAPEEKKYVTEDMQELGNDIIGLLNERTENPGDAFVLMQQLTIFLWDTYKIDWEDKPGSKVADTKKQRYLDFVSGLVDNMTGPSK